MPNPKKVCSWKDRWMDWGAIKAYLRIAYSNLKFSRIDLLVDTTKLEIYLFLCIENFFFCFNFFLLSMLDFFPSAAQPLDWRGDDCEHHHHPEALFHLEKKQDRFQDSCKNWSLKPSFYGCKKALIDRQIDRYGQCK